ncbi:sulfurtransferase TusA-like protein [Sporosarcina newyorkensis 2681]|uniref:Sulfurtransferase TusA-like protein n=1 Tax=Sporosarcina newyorkensis 2681 TaxID=1027292 RepID=F9DS72_9BACL|nr:sulfurtransferase TusA family protein [Sporosarcina newyorkensis]EGQ26372.1 sulfurtransferase TusA-like protein [Sporosarcina newyorkensis 2681]
MNTTKFLDDKGLACPMPIVRTKKAMKELEAGDILEIHATDKGSVADLTAWAASGNHKVVDQQQESDVFKFWIQKG